MIRTLIDAELRHHLRDPVTILALVLGQGLVYPAVGVGLASAHKAGSDKAESAEIALGVTGGIERLSPFADERTRLVEGDGEDASILLSAPGEPFVAEIRYSTRGRNAMSARKRSSELAERAGESERAAAFAAVGAADPARTLVTTERDVVPSAARTLRLAASALPALLMFLVGSGGIYTALDVVTGEKERGTVETLLTTSADRREIAAAKTLAVLILVMLAALVSLTSLFVTARLPLTAEIIGETAIPARAWGLALLLFVPLAATLAAVLTAAAARVPDFKSGQVYALPALLAPTALAAVALLPDATLTPVVALIPFSNLSVALKEVLLGTAEPLPLVICLVASTFYASVALVTTTRWLGREEILLGDRGGRHRRLRGDYVPDALGAVAFGIALLWLVAAPAQAASFAWGMAASQFGLFLPLALATPWFVGLRLRETLGLHVPSARDLALGVAAGFLCPALGLTVAEAQAAFLPASPEVMEVLESMIPRDLPLLAMFAVVALSPGICEEALFRGAIQGLLGRSLRPVAAVLVTALAFGLFHISLFRILPTAALGIVFGVARARTGTLMVPVVMHVMNNGLFVATGAAEIEVAWSPWMLLGVLGLAGVLWGMGPRGATGSSSRAPRG